MSANPPLQARAGSNSPEQSVAPEYRALLAYNKKIPTAPIAPGVDIKVADGGKGLLSFTGLRVFLGPNAGAAALSVTGFIKDPEGNTIQSDTAVLGPGANAGANFSLTQLLPEGYSLWVNVTLTAGVYGGDAEILFSLMDFDKLKDFGPVELSMASAEILKSPAGHTVLFGLIQTAVYNTDTAPHDFEVYLSDDEGDTLVGVGTLAAGALDSILPGVPLALNGGNSVKMRITTAIATAGRKVVAMGSVNESNQLNR